MNNWIKKTNSLKSLILCQGLTKGLFLGIIWVTICITAQFEAPLLEKLRILLRNLFHVSYG